MAILITVIAGLFFVIGFFIANIKKDNSNLSSFSIGMAFSVLVLLVIFDIIPEINELLNNSNYLYSIISVIFGLVFFKIIDMFIPHHDHEIEKKEHTHEKHLFHIGFITCIALIIHNVIEGMGIYEMTSYNTYSGLLMAIGVGLHNLPFGIEITATMQEKNENIRSIKFIILLLFLSTTLGAIIASFIPHINSLVLAILMSITIGMILYLLIFELFDEIRKTDNKKYSYIGMFCGIVIMTITVLIGG